MGLGLKGLHICDNLRNGWPGLKLGSFQYGTWFKGAAYL